MLPRVLDANEDGTVTVDATFVRELAALVTISRDLSKMVDERAARPVLGPEARRGGFPPRTLGLIFGKRVRLDDGTAVIISTAGASVSRRFGRLTVRSRGRGRSGSCRGCRSGSAVGAVGSPGTYAASPRAP